MPINESQLLLAFSQGDRKAFEQLFNTYYQPTCRYVQRIIRDSDTAEEIAQSTFVNLWEKREMLHEDISFKAYLFRAAHNTALNYIKHQKIVIKYATKHQDSIQEIKASYVSHQPDFELQKRIEKSLKSLPPQCQKVFRMSREEGLKYHEIAIELGISKKTVEVHMGKALKILRIGLKDYLSFFLPLVVFL
ncbi:MAG: RNA polymerase sigma-70 factor (ECF subfamily) [Roseivirga sp.]